MIIKLTENDIKTLVEEKDGWSYCIKTKTGLVKGSEISTKEDAIKHCEDNLVRIVRKMINK